MINWIWEPSSLSLNALFEKGTAWNYFVGSGISIDPPSNLPCGYEVTHSVVEQIIPSEKIEKILQFSSIERVNELGLGNFLRFEKVMDYITHFDPDLHILDFFGSCDSPNIIHYYLALMGVRHNPIITTNFDSLIEIALSRLGYGSNKISPLIFPEDYQDINSSNYNIYKLHGSLYDVKTGKDSRSSLQATLSQISESTKTHFTLPDYKKYPFEQLMKDHGVVILGYSGLDDFDILPTISDIKSEKRMIWVSHSNFLTSEYAQIFHCRESNGNGDHEEELSSEVSKDYINQYLSSLAAKGFRNPQNLFRVYVNTASLIKWLWRRYISSDPFHFPIQLPLHSVVLPGKSKKSHIFSLNISDVSKWNLCGSLFLDFNSLRESQDSFLMGLSLARTEGNIPAQIKLLENLGKIEFRKNGIQFNIKDSPMWKYLNIALTLAKDHGLKRFEMEHYFLLGEINETKWLDEALFNYMDGLKIAEELGESQYVLLGKINIARIHRKRFEWAEADTTLEEAYTYFDRINFKLQTIATLERACVDAGLGFVQDAIDSFNDALKIVDKTGDLYKRFQILWDKAILYEEMGDLTNAMEIYEKIMSLVKLSPEAYNKGILEEIERIKQEYLTRLKEEKDEGVVEPDYTHIFFPY